MKTSELTGALLDYWVARAEGVPAEEVEVRLIPLECNRHLAPGGLICTRDYHDIVAYSTEWEQGGPLIEKHRLNISETDPPGWVAWSNDLDMDYGDSPLQAICRAVVRASFGDEVEDVQP